MTDARYDSKNACLKCGSTIRYKSNHGCVSCLNRRAIKNRMARDHKQPDVDKALTAKRRAAEMAREMRAVDDDIYGYDA